MSPCQRELGFHTIRPSSTILVEDDTKRILSGFDYRYIKSSAFVLSNLEPIPIKESSSTQWSDYLENTSPKGPFWNNTSNFLSKIETPSQVVGFTNSKKRKSLDYYSTSLLHNTCKLFSQNVTVVKSALEMDPDSIRSEVSVPCQGPKAKRVRVPFPTTSTSTTASYKTFQVTTTKPKIDTYKFPVNVALSNDASTDVLDVLIKAGPDVLAKQDGPDNTSTLSIALLSALSMQQQDSPSHIVKDKSTATTAIEDIVNMILDANSESASVIDRFGNLPLHYAVRITQLSLKTLAKIYMAYPEALRHKNFLRKTPLDVAIVNAYVSDDKVNFLQHITYNASEGRAIFNLDIFEKESNQPCP